MTLISKRFYALTLFRELGITNCQSRNTYNLCKNINNSIVLKKLSDDLFTYFGIFVSEQNKCLTSIHWLLIQFKARYLGEALNCSVKPLSKYIPSYIFQSNKFTISNAHIPQVLILFGLS